MKIITVILNWNGKDDTLACLNSLGSAHPIIVVDNGSHDDSAAEIQKQFPHVHLIQTGLNLGYAGGNNIGIQKALDMQADAVLLLNNDTIVHPGFNEALIKNAKQNPHIGIFGAYPLRFYDPSHLDHLGGVWNSKKGDFDLVGLQAPQGFQTDLSLDYVCGCSILIRRTVFDAIGFLEPKFFLFWEEADFAMRAKKAGFTIGICYEATLLHKVSASFVGGSPQKKYFWWRGRLLWMERNCPPEEKSRHFKKFISPELWHYKKLYWIKQAELTLLKLFKAKGIPQKQEKIYQYRAVLAGIQDYKKGRFGAGPAWLTLKNGRN